MMWIWFLLAGIFLLSFIIQLVYLFRFFNKLPSFKKFNTKTQNDPVSVIICARNQAENLKHYLPIVLNQIYPDFEVIVVNDGSTDNTEEILEEFKRQYPNLYVTGIEGKRGYVSGKKVAQTIGIKAAKNELLVFTDPNSEPLSPHWLTHIQSNFLQKTEIVLAFGGYKSRKGLLNKWLRTDNIHLAMIYMGFAIKGIPIMGIGRNLAFRKSLFFENKGFAKHLHLPSGEDEIFVNENGTRYNTAIELHPESFTMSEPAKSWKEWERQKRSRLKNRTKFKKAHRKLLATEVRSRILFFATGIVLLSFLKFTGFVIIMLLIREITYSLIFKLTMKHLKEKNLLLISLIYDLIWPLLTVILLFRNKLAPKTPKWK